jgi:probable dihydroxyacetone kinase regulator
MSDSLITKKALASGLKELTKKKSFDKITVHDIAEICSLNRQTFYYHFQDKYELLNWIYYNEAISLIIDDLNYNNWDAKLLNMLTKMKEESYFYENTLKLSADNGFRDSLFGIASELFQNIIDKIFEHNTFGEDERKFISEFYAYGIVGVIIAWAQRGMKETPEYITSQLRNVSYGTQKFAAKRFMENNKSCHKT